LVGEQLKLREKEIVDMEASIRNTIGARFGSNGEVNQLRSNLTKPYQDQIWNAIKTVSTKNNLGIVLIKQPTMFCSRQKYDYTDAVLSLLVKICQKLMRRKNNALPGGNNKGQNGRTPKGKINSLQRKASSNEATELKASEN
jgi:outer membrane protein